MNARDLQSTTATGVARRLFGIDVRSLAALRIGIACVILFDLLFFRLPFVEAFLSDKGFLTRKMAEEVVGVGYWSLYGFDGSVANAVLLISINILAASALLVGFRTRTMTIVCLVLAWSIQMRNPFVLSGGDVLLRMLLVWSVFLPLGAVWSVDQWLSPFRRPARYVEASVASAAIMIQMAILYFFAGLAKCNSFWLGGAAVELAMQLEMYTKPFANVILAVPWVLAVATWGVLVLELLGPWLLFMPWQNRRIRLTLLVSFWLMHIGIWLTMSIGFFSVIAMIGWLVFVPTSFWDYVFRRPDEFDVDQPADFPGIRKLANGFCAFALLFCLAINVANVKEEPPKWYSNWGQLFAKTTMLIQGFELWGTPPTVSPSFSYPAVTGKGKIDLLAWRLADQLEKPDNEFAYLRAQSWRRFHWELRNESELHLSVRKKLLGWLVEKWNASHDADNQIVSAQLIYEETPIPVLNHDPNTPEVWATWP